jgi:L-lactate dehydrogenase complex protein LldF
MEMQKQFLKDAERVAFDLEHRRKIKHNISRYDAAVPKGKAQFADLENARCRAANTKHKMLNDLDHYLIEFEKNFEKNGGKVIWAPTKKDAMREILAILKNRKAKLVVKSKSIMSEELEINDILEKKKIEPLETDLGEYIVQLAGEKPYHILTPAMHKSKEDVAKLFHEKFGLDESSTPEQITRYVRALLREKFQEADAGITGANFLVADTGSVCLTENEGNALMSVSFPKVHIAIAGIEKVIPSLADLHLFWPLLATMGTGQKVTAYNSILSGPAKEGETDGPEEMYVILLDNRRTEVMKNERLRRSMSCIRCGACLNACPIYKNIGGYTYASTYTGPIGSVITPHMENMRDYKHLSFASSLCGKCTEVCPVKIPLHELLLLNRQESVKDGFTTTGEQFIMRNIRSAMLKRSWMNMGSGSMKNILIRSFFGKAWGPRREFPKLEPKPFNKMWRDLQAQQRKVKKEDAD